MTTGELRAIKEMEGSVRAFIAQGYDKAWARVENNLSDNYSRGQRDAYLEVLDILRAVRLCMEDDR